MNLTTRQKFYYAVYTIFTHFHWVLAGAGFLAATGVACYYIGYGLTYKQNPLVITGFSEFVNFLLTGFLWATAITAGIGIVAGVIITVIRACCKGSKIADYMDKDKEYQLRIANFEKEIEKATKEENTKAQDKLKARLATIEAEYNEFLAKGV